MAFVDDYSAWIARPSAEANREGMRGAIHDTLGSIPDGEPVTYSITVGTRTEQHVYTAKLAAIAMAMRCLPPDLLGRQVTIFTRN
jgi:hypothetical protein